MAASLALTSGTTMREIFRPRASIAMGRAPRTLRMPPSRESSPTKRQSEISLLIRPAIGTENTQRHRQVETRAFLFYVCRCEIDSDVGQGDVITAIPECGSDPVPAFANGVRQTDGVEVVFFALNAGNINFDFNDVGVNAIDGGAEGLVEH